MMIVVLIRATSFDGSFICNIRGISNRAKSFYRNAVFTVCSFPAKQKRNRQSVHSEAIEHQRADQKSIILLEFPASAVFIKSG